MNNLLQIKGQIKQKANRNRPGSPNVPKGKYVNQSHVEKLVADLHEQLKQWKSQNIIPGALVSVFYNKLVAKSNRIGAIFAGNGMTSNSSIRGAKYADDDLLKHIVTHYVSLELIEESIDKLLICIEILNKEFRGNITYDNMKNINDFNIDFKRYRMAKTTFQRLVVDCYYVEKFDVYVDSDIEVDKTIVTLYKTKISPIEMMKNVGFNLPSNRVIGSSTVLLMNHELELLKIKAPYLVSMAVGDFSKLDFGNFDLFQVKPITIPSPTNEPTIGVLDTLFDENVYFSEWVDYKIMIDENIPVSPIDYKHGTAVSSIIVDGPAGNPELDDGCGRFKVRHFGIATSGATSSFAILRHIEEAVCANRDIKVWNLSLGSKMEIMKNSISPEGAILDKIQYKYDVIFIIAGTNDADNSMKKKIGSPADSINAIVVNSVDKRNKPAKYTRLGPVLSFFTKPDISYYGGDKDYPMRVCTSMGEAKVTGTSYAAPWIARKMAYLIHILGLGREEAKALLINSSTGWDKEQISSFAIGHGIVPINIQDIVKTKNDEIQFLISGVSEKYDSYTYDIPVPIHKGKHPYIAKATLCYFPYCDRNFGVDYTSTELNVKFGKVGDKGIKSINNNYQDEDRHSTYEKDARQLLGKWDNVKHIREINKKGVRDKAVISNGLWGISVTTKERFDEKFGQGIKFGVVVTLKELHGVNRIDEFISQCSLRGWLVNEIDVENTIDIYNLAEEELELS